MPIFCPKLIYLLYDLICHCSETFAKSTAFFHSIPPIDLEHSGRWVFSSIYEKKNLKFLTSPSSSSWDLRNASRSSEIRHVREKFIRFVKIHQKFVKFGTNLLEERQVCQKFVKFFGGPGGDLNSESRQPIFVIWRAKQLIFFRWCKQHNLLWKYEIWRTWQTFDELDEPQANLTNFWLVTKKFPKDLM